jgi:hypothetical protein
MQVTNFSSGPEMPIGEAPAHSLRFDIVIRGKKCASATLWIDSESGLPVRREQIVELSSGAILVVENYSYADAED